MLLASRYAIRRVPMAATGILLVIGLALAPAELTAQVLYGSIVGNVTDNTGAAMPGATVTITHVQTNTTREAITDGTGSYRFPTLQPGGLHGVGGDARLQQRDSLRRQRHDQQHLAD